MNINESKYNDGSTPLMNAAKSKNLATVEWLLINGANPKLTDKKGRDAFMYSIYKRSNKNTKIDFNISMLLEKSFHFMNEKKPFYK